MWSVKQISTAACSSTHSVSFWPGNASTSSFSGHTLKAGGSLRSKGARRSDGSLLCTREEKLTHMFNRNALQRKQGAYLCKHFLNIPLYYGQKSNNSYKNKTQTADDSAGMTVWMQPSCQPLIHSKHLSFPHKCIFVPGHHSGLSHHHLLPNPYPVHPLLTVFKERWPGEAR